MSASSPGTGSLDFDKRVGEMEEANCFSFEETRIGTWIDGKPLYRKVVSAVIDTTSEFQNIALGVQNANIVNANFTVSKPGAIIDFANVNVSNSFIRVFYEINNKVFTIHRSGDFLTYVNIVVIAEYTKTTD